MKEIKKAVKSQRRFNIFKSKFEKENSIFKAKKKEERETPVNTEKENDDKVISRKRIKQKQLNANLNKSVVFVNSTFRRDALEYALKEEGFLYSPEQIVLAIAIAEEKNCTVDQSLEEIKNGEISDEIVFQTNSYLEKGMNMIESMKDKNTEKMTRTEKTAGNIAKLYNKYYAEWEKNVKNRNMRQESSREHP